LKPDGLFLPQHKVVAPVPVGKRGTVLIRGTMHGQDILNDIELKACPPACYV
jgi:hypothetical protein